MKLSEYRRRFSIGWARHYRVPMTTRVPRLTFCVPLLRPEGAAPSECPSMENARERAAAIRAVLERVARDVRSRLRSDVPDDRLARTKAGGRFYDPARARINVREAIVHLRHAWIAHNAGNSVLFELECCRARLMGFMADPLPTVGVASVLKHKERQREGARAAARRYRAKPDALAGRNRRIIADAKAGRSAAEIGSDYGLSDRQIRSIVNKAKRK